MILMFCSSFYQMPRHEHSEMSWSSCASLFPYLAIPKSPFAHLFISIVDELMEYLLTKSIVKILVLIPAYIFT